MSIALSTAEQELSRQLGDYWGGTTTSAGSTTALVDTGLMAKANDWVTDDSYDQITGGTVLGYGGSTCDGEERKISSLSNTDGTLTVLTHTGAPGITVTYRVHRLFTASEKRRALVSAAKSVFPHIFKKIRDESLTVGNWLRDGDLEYNWTSATVNTYWKRSVVTMTKNTTAPYYYRGATSCALSGSSGYFYQSNTENADLMDLAGQSVTFECHKAYCNAANSLRLMIYDGTTETYSSYHAGDSKPATLSVSATIASSPSAVSFRVYYTTGATAHVDDFRVYGATRNKLYIGDLGLAQNYPHQVRQSSDSNINNEPWQLLRNYTIGSDGYIYLEEGSQNYRLRILGIGYLDFLVSGVSSTTWASEIVIDAPQLEILVAQAALYLCNQKIVPTDTAGTSQAWAQAKAYWDAELNMRKAKFGMMSPSATTSWGV